MNKIGKFPQVGVVWIFLATMLQSSDLLDDDYEDKAYVPKNGIFERRRLLSLIVKNKRI